MRELLTNHDFIKASVSILVLILAAISLYLIISPDFQSEATDIQTRMQIQDLPESAPDEMIIPAESEFTCQDHGDLVNCLGSRVGDVRWNNCGQWDLDDDKIITTFDQDMLLDTLPNKACI